jgi:hypothetical protein
MRRLLVVAIAAALVFAAAAAADGDPASDFLVQQDVFVPYPPPASASLKALSSAVDVVDTKGDRVKVAVIATTQDLGSVPSLYNQPAQYARFLSAEIAFVYKGPLLIVMPAGAALYDRQTGAALTGAKPGGASATELTSAAAADVTAFERAGDLHYRDTYRPSTFVAPAKATAGKTAQLRYQAWDDSGRASVLVTVETAAGRKLVQFEVARRQVRQGAWYAVAWPVPKTIGRATLALCATATDPAGNTSRKSCGKLTVT